MARTPTKAQIILNEAQGRVENARTNVREKRIGLSIAESTLVAYEESYESLKIALAPKSRSNGHKPASKKPLSTLDGGVSKMRCAQAGCGEYADHSNHDAGYLSSHPFVASSSAPRAGRKSSRSKSSTATPSSTATTQSAQSTLGEVGSVGVVSSEGGGE